MAVDVNKVVEVLLNKLAKLEKENAILLVQNIELEKKLQEQSKAE